MVTFRALALVGALVSFMLENAGCNAILDIRDHPLARLTGSEAGSPIDGGQDPLPAFGALYTVGRVPDEANVGYLPDGRRVAVTEDGFEPGGTLCSGTICVTGAITP